MENAADALKMAAAVLIFVLAISIAILAFGQVRETSDTMLEFRDRETVDIDGEYYYKTSGTERSVNLETIIPSIFRVYLENYRIVFEGLEKPIYNVKYNGTYMPKTTLDLETNLNTIYQNVVLANDDQKTEFLCGILYGDFSKSGGKTSFEKKFNVSLTGCESIYDQLVSATSQRKTITEYLGVYYQNDAPNVPDSNKTEKRIITYKIQ